MGKKQPILKANDTSSSIHTFLQWSCSLCSPLKCILMSVFFYELSLITLQSDFSLRCLLHFFFTNILHFSLRCSRYALRVKHTIMKTIEVLIPRTKYTLYDA